MIQIKSARVIKIKLIWCEIDNISVQPVIIDEDDGTKVGMSQTGLARFCGVARNTIQELLKKTRPESAPKELEPLHSMDFYLHEITSNKQAIVIDANACAEIVWYYAIKETDTKKSKSISEMFPLPRSICYSRGVDAHHNNSILT